MQLNTSHIGGIVGALGRIIIYLAIVAVPLVAFVANPISQPVNGSVDDVAPSSVTAVSFPEKPDKISVPTGGKVTFDVDSVTTGPAVEVADLERQYLLNSGELEITNVRLGKLVNPQRSGNLTVGIKLAAVATERSPIPLRPEATPVGVQVDGIFTLGDQPKGGSDNGEVKVASTDVNNPVIARPNSVGLQLPKDSFAIAGLPKSKVDLSLGPISLDTATPLAPQAHRKLDQSPFGIRCSSSITARPRPGAMVGLTIKAPCYPNSRVQIRHEALVFSVLTSHSGTVSVSVPAFSNESLFSVSFPNGETLAIRTTLPSLKNFTRVAIIWKGPVNIDLHGLEFGAKAGSPRDIWAGNARRPDNRSGGFLVKLGDPSLHQAELAEVYTYRTGAASRPGVVSMALRVHSKSEDCAAFSSLKTLRSTDGKVSASGGFRLTPDACANSPDDNLLLSAVSDLRVVPN